MTSSFLWTTIYVLLWNYVIYTSGGIVSYGHEDKSIDLRRRKLNDTHNDKRQAKETKPVTNGKFNEPSSIAGFDFMGNPFLRLPPNESPVSIKKLLAPSGHRDKSDPKHNDSIKSNRLDNAFEKSMLRTPQESSYLSTPSILPDTSYSAENINNLINYYGHVRIPPDDSIDETDVYFYSLSPNGHGISQFVQRDNISPQFISKSSNPSIFSNNQMSNSVINKEPCDDNVPQPMKSLQQKLWNEQIQSSFFDFPLPTSQLDKLSVNKPIIQPISSDKDYFISPSKTIIDDESESLKFLQLLPQNINSKFVYHKESIFDNKTPLFSSQNRFTAPLDTLYGEKIQSDWPNQIIKTSGLESQSILPPPISLMYGQQNPITELSESLKTIETAATTSSSKPISMEKIESTSQLYEQQQKQITTLSDSSQLIESPSITSTSKPTSIEKVESTSLLDEQNQMTDLPESSELTETPSITSTIKPTKIEEEESTPPTFEQQQTTVTDVTESPNLTEPSSINSMTLTSTPAPTKKEEPTSPSHEKLSRPLSVPANLIKTPTITTTSTPISLKKKPPMFMPSEQPLINWSPPPQLINALATEIISPPAPAQDDTSIYSLGLFPFENEQKPLSTNVPQFITPTENFKYYNDAYHQILQQPLYTSQPIRNSFPLTRPEQNQDPFAVPNFSNPLSTFSEYYSHMLSENIEPCNDELV